MCQKPKAMDSPFPRTKADLLEAIEMHKHIASKWENCYGVNTFHMRLAIELDEQLTMMMGQQQAQQMGIEKGEETAECQVETDRQNVPCGTDSETQPIVTYAANTSFPMH